MRNAGRGRPGGGASRETGLLTWPCQAILADTSSGCLERVLTVATEIRLWFGELPWGQIWKLRGVVRGPGTHYAGARGDGSGGGRRAAGATA